MDCLMKYTVLAFLLFCNSAFAEVVPNYDARLDLVSETFDAIWDKHGLRLRTSAVLRACGKHGLAESIDKKESYIVGEVMAEIMISDDKYLDFRTEGETALFHIVQSIHFMNVMYKQSFQRATEAFEPLIGFELYDRRCSVATDVADMILQDNPATE